jgi:integrase
MPPIQAVSLLEMCRLYVQQLENVGKVSASEVKNLVERHIAPTKLAKLSARDIKSPSFTELLRDVIASSSGRTAGKVRSILHAAYARAIRAKLDPSAPRLLVDFEVEVNPISSIDSLAQYQKARDRYLKDSELRGVWKRLQITQSSSIGVRAARLCVLLGGQRAQQLVSVTVERVDLDALTILLFDPKGRRATPRPHLLPLCQLAEADVRWLVTYAKSVKSIYLFPGSVSGTYCNAGTVSKEVLSIRRDMQNEGICEAHFAYTDFRRTVETKLASMEVSEDVRAQLQSHGLGGVQNKHYNRHDYMPEKIKVLTMWEQYLNSLFH